MFLPLNVSIRDYSPKLFPLKSLYSIFSWPYWSCNSLIFFSFEMTQARCEVLKKAWNSMSSGGVKRNMFLLITSTSDTSVTTNSHIAWKVVRKDFFWFPESVICYFCLVAFTLFQFALLLQFLRQSSYFIPFNSKLELRSLQFGVVGSMCTLADLSCSSHDSFYIMETSDSCRNPKC